MGNKQENTKIKNQLKKQKRTILIVFLCLVGFVALYCLLSMVDWQAIFNKEEPASPQNIYFYSEELSENLYSDEEYMSLDRSINLKKESTGWSDTITEEDLTSYNEAVNLIYSFIEYSIIGNVEAYNGCFSPIYYSQAAPKERFTKQKLYNITITEISITTKSDQSGASYTEYHYKLEYMIRHNNGSLRDDVGSDGIKPLYLYLSDRSGEVLIDTLYTLNYVSKQ